MLRIFLLFWCNFFLFPYFPCSNDYNFIQSVLKEKLICKVFYQIYFANLLFKSKFANFWLLHGIVEPICVFIYLYFCCKLPFSPYYNFLHQNNFCIFRVFRG